MKHKSFAKTREPMQSYRKQVLGGRVPIIKVREKSAFANEGLDNALRAAKRLKLVQRTEHEIL
jgi:hypothetical protein